jgi:hypothetical protein
MKTGVWCVPCVLAAVALTLGSEAIAQQRHAVVVSGATGGDEYADRYRRWSADLSRQLVENLKFDSAHVTVLSETDAADLTATASNVRRAFAALRERMSPGDLLLVILIGHGTFDGVDARFNLVGPDLESVEWAALLRPIPGRLVIINTTSASFPFLERLAAPRRIVITATDSAAQRFDTVFPEYFIRALSDETADIDKNRRISIWEAFAAASSSVRHHYQQRGHLSTERALLDDNGDGIGTELAADGGDGSLASRTYLDHPLPGAPPTDEVLLKLLQRKAMLEGQVEELRIRRTFLPPAEYKQEFERMMIELAKVSHEVRARTGS